MEKVPVQPGGEIVPSRFETLRQKLPKWPTHVWIFLAVLAVTLIVGGIYLYLSPQLRQRLFQKIGPAVKSENIWTPYTPPPASLAHGKQTYMISGSTQGAPKIAEATVDPIDPARGSIQKWTLRVLEPNDKSVKEVYVTVMTDSEKTIIGLKKVSGTERDGVWEGIGRIKDSYDYSYRALLFAKNDANLAHTLTLTFR